MAGINAEGVKFKEFEWNWNKHKPRFVFPALRDLTLQSTPNTMRVCYTCRGTRFVEIKHQSGKITLRPCMNCKGSGSVKN